MPLCITIANGHETVTIEELQEATLVATSCIIQVAMKTEIGSPLFKQLAKSRKTLRTVTSALSPREVSAETVPSDPVFHMGFYEVAEMHEMFATLDADALS